VSEPQTDLPQPLASELHYRVLRLLAERPQATQRELARTLGVSLGRTNYCVRALLERGWVKVQNFRSSRNKLAYLYLLTPQGIEAKARLAARFLERKEAEYAALREEIARLRAEVKESSVRAG